MKVIDQRRSTCPQLGQIVRRYCVRIAVPWAARPDRLGVFFHKGIGNYRYPKTLRLGCFVEAYIAKNKKHPKRRVLVYIDVDGFLCTEELYTGHYSIMVDHRQQPNILFWKQKQTTNRLYTHTHTENLQLTASTSQDKDHQQESALEIESSPQKVANVHHLLIPLAK